MAVVLLFAAARQAAGRSTDVIDADTLAGVLETACIRYGPNFRNVLSFSRVWVNGALPHHDAVRVSVNDGDEVAVLPPISGG